MQRIGFILILTATFYVANAQEEAVERKVKFNTKLDLHSSHLWRGFKNGNAFSIQPTISASKGSLNIGSWAAYSGNDSYFEIDFFAEYTYKSITLSLYDYYCPKTTQIDGLFEFRKFHTRHTLDAMLVWNPKNLPFKLLASTFVLGDDISPNNGKQVYSTYIEPAITWNFKRFLGEIFAGYTPFQGYYASSSAFVNIGSSVTYKIQIRGYNLPIQSKFSYNPVLKTYAYSIGVSVETNF